MKESIWEGRIASSRKAETLRQAAQAITADFFTGMAIFTDSDRESIRYDNGKAKLAALEKRAADAEGQNQ